ncbi:hypothetical protein CONPUDRAFT_63989, partial [Coniophora puteana RWD-64-598 SS2]
SSSIMLPPPQSEMEAKCYYAGLPSSPILVARTGATQWKAPTGPEAYLERKELRAVGRHALKEIWEGGLALKIHAILDSMTVKWTSTDVVRIRNVETSFAPVILWIGVMPASLSGDDGVVAANKCRELLVEHDIDDVDVEIRESIVARSTGPKFLKSVYSSNPTVDVREPLTTTLGLPICAQSTPWVEGTGGFFITEGGNAERLLLVTARHVVFTPDKNENKHFEHTNSSQPRHNVMLFSDAGFEKYLKSIKAEIGGKVLTAQHHEDHFEAMEGRNDPTENKERQRAQAELEREREAMEKLHTFYQEVSAHWGTPESRVLGHVVLSPPINIGSSGGYTEDWAVIEIDASKVDASNFEGNGIDLGTRIHPYDLVRMMRPNYRNADSFTYPIYNILRLTDTIPDEEMRYPTVLDENDEPSLMVIKRGHATGLTVGRANDIFSYIRYYHDDETTDTSKEWAILSFDYKSGAFAEKGDSGSVIVDGLGRIGGLLTGGAGGTRSPDSKLDITYATPVNFILNRMQENGLREPNVNPVLAA